MTVEQLKERLAPFFTKHNQTGLQNVSKSTKKVGYNWEAMKEIHEVIEGKAVLKFNVDLSRDITFEERSHYVLITVDIQTLEVVKVSVAQCNKGAKKHNSTIKEAAMILFAELIEKLHNNEANNSQPEEVQESVESTPVVSETTVIEQSSYNSEEVDSQEVTETENTYNSDETKFQASETAQNAITADTYNSTENVKNVYHVYNSEHDKDWANQIIEEIKGYQAWVKDGYMIQHALYQIEKLQKLYNSVIFNVHDNSSHNNSAITETVTTADVHTLPAETSINRDGYTMIYFNSNDPKFDPMKLSRLEWEKAVNHHYSTYHTYKVKEYITLEQIKELSSSHVFWFKVINDDCFDKVSVSLDLTFMYLNTGITIRMTKDEYYNMMNIIHGEKPTSSIDSNNLVLTA